VLERATVPPRYMGNMRICAARGDGKEDEVAMTVRFELFVDDLDRSIRFWEEVLGFGLERRDKGYASMRHGSVVIGLGPVSKLPEGAGHFTRERLAGPRGMGVEIVLEADDLAALHARVIASSYPLHEPWREQPWGLADFRLVDPDGYYLRVTSHE